ncbi:electron transport complex subunit RsxC [bacterium]|nr:electron transport complex subunit RsxC [candidate division CSSED10-310 bacterium]
MPGKLLTFRSGGVHPPGNKHLSEHKPIRRVPLPETVSINLNQHLGKPAQCAVKIKQEISVGERIGEADGFISADIHSPVSGTVRKIQTVMTAVGTMAESVLIEVDSEKTAEDLKKYQSTPDCAPEKLGKKEILEAIKQAGIVGEGGAAFPTHIKLAPPPDKPIDTVILNGAECEPFLTADHQLMLEKTAEILTGARILRHILEIDSIIIGIENNKPDAIRAFEKLIETDSYPGMRIAALKTKYPQGGEKQLIKAILDREVPSGKLPFDVGVIVQNVGTVFAVYEAVYCGKPLIQRVVTISGFVNNPGNYLLPLGVSFEHAIRAGAGGFRDDTRVKEVINGGPMMGKAVRQLDVTVTKGTSGILVLSDQEFSYDGEGPCIRCGRCIDTCPMGLMPTLLAMNARYERIEGLKSVMDCIECGTCSYVCPTHRQLVHWIRAGKVLLRKANRSVK